MVLVSALSFMPGSASACAASNCHVTHVGDPNSNTIGFFVPGGSQNPNTFGVFVPSMTPDSAGPNN
ncbi:MAG: hypothetical protein K1X87_05955 [Dehalococcoidia bacterium]|nr:hypothetical protein [Dehalococcoidia bacterium]